MPLSKVEMFFGADFFWNYHYIVVQVLMGFDTSVFCSRNLSHEKMTKKEFCWSFLLEFGVRDATGNVCDLMFKSSLHVLLVELYICMKVG